MRTYITLNELADMMDRHRITVWRDIVQHIHSYPFTNLSENPDFLVSPRLYGNSLHFFDRDEVENILGADFVEENGKKRHLLRLKKSAAFLGMGLQHFYHLKKQSIVNLPYVDFLNGAYLRVCDLNLFKKHYRRMYPISWEEILIREKQENTPSVDA
jgi:hypothetical protein